MLLTITNLVQIYLIVVFVDTLGESLLCYFCHLRIIYTVVLSGSKFVALEVQSYLLNPQLHVVSQEANFDKNQNWVTLLHLYIYISPPF